MIALLQPFALFVYSGCSPKGGPWTSTVSIMWGLAINKDTDSQVLSRPTESGTLEVGLSQQSGV